MDVVEGDEWNIVDPMYGGDSSAFSYKGMKKRVKIWIKVGMYVNLVDTAVNRHRIEFNLLPITLPFW